MKSNWNQVLFQLEAENRVAWLTFFDARLVKIEADQLFLDFSDSEKFSGSHSYADARGKYVSLLESVITEVTGSTLKVKW